MASDGHLLVTGGPGSGKTTVSILKAAQIAEQELGSQQKVLFLSFARASVSRIVKAIQHEQSISYELKQRIEVETYHSLFWRILRAHGYLVGLPRRLVIITPPAEAIALSAIRSNFEADKKLNDCGKVKKQNAEFAELNRLASDEGRICFDLFALFVGDLLHRSKRIRRLLAIMYPVIILDEFQDTNRDQWHVVKALGDCSRLFALADPEQRIYDFIGADPERLNHFIETFNPTEFDLSNTNHRSTGTDIGQFGNDILTGKYRQSCYKGINVEYFDPISEQAMSKLVRTTYKARKRLNTGQNREWSLAILVPTKKMTRQVSVMFRSPPAKMKPISHIASIDFKAAILGSEIIAYLMQPKIPVGYSDDFVRLMCNYFQGKDEGRLTKKALKEAMRICNAYKKWCAAADANRNPPRNSILNNTFKTFTEACDIKLTGVPDRDWLAIRRKLEKSKCNRLKEIGTEAQNIRILDRGSQLRRDLTQDWRDNGCYANALKIVQRAFVQEHFATDTKPESGVIIMNMHKAKGKQFDEVIIFEGWIIKHNRTKGKKSVKPDRIVRNNDRDEVNDGFRHNFRVSVTRACQRTTILTPKNDPCVLLSN